MTASRCPVSSHPARQIISKSWHGFGGWFEGLARDLPRTLPSMRVANGGGSRAVPPYIRWNADLPVAADRHQWIEANRRGQRGVNTDPVNLLLQSNYRYFNGDLPLHVGAAVKVDRCRLGGTWIFTILPPLLRGRRVSWLTTANQDQSATEVQAAAQSWQSPTVVSWP